MELLVVSFVAGILTVAAPCILPLLPVIVGGAAVHAQDGAKRPSLKHPLIIALSLAVSIILFTLLLKATAVLLGVPTAVWSVVAGVIIIFFGVNLLFPVLWDKLMIATNLQAKTNQLMSKSQQSKGVKRDILLGASLGPVFNSCSPTYALIVAAVLPASFFVGLSYLTAYALGVALILLLIGLFGGVVAFKLRWLANPNGWFKKVIGILFITVGLVVMFGLDKKIQAYVLEQGWYDPIMRIEESFRR
jgi:cytochrome c biogenesis protein CcdA